MTPSELAEYLRVMRDAGCMSAELTMPMSACRGSDYCTQQQVTIRAVFAPPEPMPFGDPIGSKDDEPAPGDWKRQP